MCRSHFSKVAGFHPASLLKKRLRYSCFPLNFTKVLGTPFFRTRSGDYFESQGACDYLILFICTRLDAKVNIKGVKCFLNHSENK